MSLSEVIEMMQKIEKKCENEYKKVQEEAKKLKEHIDQRATKLLNEIKDLKKMKLKNLELQKEHLSQMIATANINDIAFVEHSDNIELLNLKKQLNQRNKELQKILKIPVFIEHRDSFEVHLETKDLLARIGQWGSVVDSGLVSVEHSVISGVPSKANVDKETHFTVQLKTKDGQIVQHGICANISITDAQNQNVGYEMVFDENENAFRVRFTPKSDGLHVVQATVHGQHLSNSPFSVQVDLPANEPMFEFIAKFGSKGSGSGQFINPYFVTACKQGNNYVSDFGNHKIQIFDSNEQWKIY